MSTARILIVEDEGLTAMELQRKLKSLGYDVPTFAFSGKEAIIKAEELKPDLILMDIFLKGKIDGITAVEEITKHQNVPIIYLTAHGDEETKNRASKTEPFAYILKPFDEVDLQKHIDQALFHSHTIKTTENSVTDSDNLEIGNTTQNQSDNSQLVNDQPDTFQSDNSQNLNDSTLPDSNDLLYTQKGMGDLCFKFPTETAIFGEDGSIICANESFLKFFSAKTFKNLEWMNLFRDLGLKDDFKEEIVSSGTIKYEYKMDPAQINLVSDSINNSLYLSLQVSELILDDKKDKDDLSGYLLHLEDITDIKQSEKHLESKSNYRLTLDAKVDISFAMDSNFNCIYWNSSAVDITGIPAEDAVGKSIYDLFPQFRNENSEDVTVKSEVGSEVSSENTEMEKQDFEDYKQKILNLEEKMAALSEELDKTKNSEKEITESLKKSERNFKELSDENKLLREDKAKLKKLTNKIQREYLEMENEFNESLKFYKNKISQLKKLKKISE